MDLTDRHFQVDPSPPMTVIGKAQVVEVKVYTNSKDFSVDYPRHNCKFFGKYDFGFILDNVEKIEPVCDILGKRFFFFIK